MLTYYDYYLAQRERTLSMSSAPRSGQAAVSVAGAGARRKEWQAFGGWRALGGDGSAVNSAATRRAVGRWRLAGGGVL